MNILRKMFFSFYKKLPIIRELRSQVYLLETLSKNIENNNIDLRRRLHFLKEASLLQTLGIIKSSNSHYMDPKRLLMYGAQFCSQNYEDGMIAEIFRRIGINSYTFVEIGVGDGSENNTQALLTQGWSGWWVEGDAQSCESIRRHLKNTPYLARQLILYESYVSPENIEKIFLDIGIPSEVDLFSLDIDQDTYHIWAALANFRPRVIVIEYNSAIPANQSWINLYKEGKVWDGTQAFGASLKAFQLLSEKFGYSLVGCDIVGVNAFFIRNDLVADKFSSPYTSENHYEPPRYGLLHRWGHRSCFFGESFNTDKKYD